jgi:hypothetical protein
MSTVAAFFAIGGGAVVVAASNVGADELGKVEIRTKDSQATADADGSQNGPAGPIAVAKATAKCKKGEQLLAGGATWSEGDDSNTENLYLSESYAKGKKWVAEGIVDFGAQGQATLTAQAICLTK